ncbi:hypothetical protein Phum_PHUM265820 [Pediculus humanus corporis]|uniref:Uncharacterized protein n=1 Tax=Pediculus humanus subsp. corporis TaxID=121224 RepID=E0VKJ4_PEDHC|nr:uncharacterized protein Phum_PHUM265820 [Pediculus humanus corporis]EEB13900.1 hypothetical protein Phum_PHUM265820 [Pediculus humanus corporis]
MKIFERRKRWLKGFKGGMRGGSSLQRELYEETGRGGGGGGDGGEKVKSVQQVFDIKSLSVSQVSTRCRESVNIFNIKTVPCF